MSGYVRTDTTNNIADGNVISAADLDNEFNGVQAAFNSSTGHTHDGSSAEGAPITKLGPTQDVTISTTVLGVKTTNTVDLGTSSLKFKDFYLAGNALIGGTLGVTSTATFSGNTVLGDADTDTITQAASYVTGTQLKSAKTATNTLSLAAYDVDGTAYTNLITLTASNTPTLALTSTGVGTINNMSIGATTASTGAFTTLTSNGATTFTAGTASTTTGTGTLVITGGLGVSGRINAANFDGIIGANTAAAGSFTTLSASSTVTLSGGTANGVAYLNGSKVLTTGSALSFDGSTVANINAGGTGFSTQDAASNFSIMRLGTDVANGYAFFQSGKSGTGTTLPFAWRQDSSELMRLTSTGLGIGNTSPASYNAAADNLVIGTSGSNGLTIVSGTTNDGSIHFADGTSGADAYRGQIFYSHAANYMVFSTDATERMRIDSSGNVGIGTSSPAVTLSVNGTIGVFGGSLNGSIGSPQLYRPASDTLAIATGAVERMRIDASGNLGIGTSSPTDTNSYSRALDIRGTSTSNGGAVYTSNSDATVRGFYGTFGASGSGSVNFGSSTSTELRFYVANSQKVTIDTSGNLLVGATSANATEKFRVATSSTEVAFFGNDSNTSGYNGIRSQIGSGGNNTSTWHFRGETRGVANWYLYGNGTTSYSSDSRLKKNIETTRDGYLNDLMQLRVVKYNWINSQDTTPKELGLIAQEVEQVFPNLVQEHDIEGVDGQRKHIKHSVMEFILIKAIQEQQALITQLTARITALEGA